MGRHLIAAGVLVLLAGCRSAGLPPLGMEQLTAASVALGSSIPDGMAALYRLRVPRSTGLRLTVNVLGEEGRMGVSESFTGLLSLTAWSSDGPPEVWDLRQECRVGRADLTGVLGVSAMPLAQAVRLLAGRLPAGQSDSVAVSTDGRLRIAGEGWECTVEVAPDPWRVVRVEDARGPGEWRVDLSDHVGSTPRAVRVERREGPWARLELVRMEWNRSQQLAPLPNLPACGSGAGRQ